MSEQFIQKMIDFLRGKRRIKISWEINRLFDANCSDRFNGCYVHYIKSRKMQEVAGEISTLVLGNSHGVYGYLPDKDEFNLSLPSQDLYYSLKLYEKYRTECKNLKTVILFYSVFSPGFEVVKTSEKYRCVWYSKYFGIKCPDKEFEKISERLIKKLSKKTDEICAGAEIPEDYRGENIDSEGAATFKDKPEYTVQKRALDHFKNNIRSNNSDKYLIELSEMVKQDNRKLVVVLAPMREDFRNWLASDRILFSGLYNIARDSGFEILNLYGDKTFTKDDFFDYDHLNPAGAEKLTKMIKENIRK